MSITKVIMLKQATSFVKSLIGASVLSELKKYKLLLAIVLLFTFLSSLGMIKHPLWSDEADTAWFAKSVLAHGLPYGWDGLNIEGYDNGKILNEDLINNISPWLQYYVTAASFYTLTPSTISARLPFVLFSVLSIPLFFLFIHRLIGSKKIAYLSVFACSVSVPFILYSYQARYNALAIFFTLWILVSTLSMQRRFYLSHFLSFCVGGILFFYTNHLIFAAFFGGLCIATILNQQYRKSLLIKLLLAGLSISVFTAPWLLIFKPSETQRKDVLVNFNFVNGSELVLRYLQDFNDNNGLPYLIMVGLVYVLRSGATKTKKNTAAILFVIQICASFLVLLSLLSIQNIHITSRSDIRYAMNIFPLLIFLTVYTIHIVLKKHKMLGILIVILYTFSNIFTLRPPIRIWLFDYIGENENKNYASPIKTVTTYLNKHLKENDTILVSPDYQVESIIFYLDVPVRFVNRIRPDNHRILNQKNSWLPTYISKTEAPPEWIVLFGKRGQAFTNYSLQDIDFSQYAETDLHAFAIDLTRPEMFIHQFAPITVYDPLLSIFIYHRNTRSPG